MKKIDDLKKHLIVKIDIELDLMCDPKLRLVKRCKKLGDLISYCYGYIDCWCNENNIRNYKDEIKNFVCNYIMDSIKYSSEEEKDKYE